MRKRILSALVCLALFVSVMPNVFAETGADKTEIIAPIQIGEYKVFVWNSISGMKPLSTIL